MEAEARKLRAQQRRETWSIKAVPLEDAGEPPAAPGTVAERFVELWQLSHSTWVFSGRAFPEYKRSEMPGKVIRPVKN
jgi:hypothetical protein